MGALAPWELYGTSIGIYYRLPCPVSRSVIIHSLDRSLFSRLIYPIG